MSVVFGSWKYIFKNFWYVLLCAILPGIFLALSLDYTKLHAYVVGFFTGTPRLGFLDFFCVWSVFRFHSALSIVYGVCTVISVILCISFLLPLIEKHMRLGRRTPNGLLSQFKSALLPSCVITVLFFAFYEIFAVIIASLLFVSSAIPSTVAVYFLSVIIYFAFFFAFFYLLSAFYLWLPCKLLTSYSMYDAFRYSYRLVSKERVKIMLAFALFFAVGMAVISLITLLPSYILYIVAALLYALLFLDFCVRMEVTYFKADRLDREDIVHSFKEY